MNVRSTVFAVTVFSTLGMSGLLHAQQTSAPANPTAANQAPVDSGLLIQTGTKQVLVDAIVTDKKGNYVPDLKAKDFHVQEDGKDQAIKSFSFEADPASGDAGKTHYLVLMFDNSSMNVGDQATARQAASKFIDTNAGPDRMMEIVNYVGGVKVAQTFTADAERLKAVVGGLQFSAVSTNNNNGASGAAADFAARGMLQSLRLLAKSLGSVPGRKILVLFTAGFRLSAEQLSEATATINECNKSNVAIYPVDVRGLTTGFGKASLDAPAILRPVLDRASPDQPQAQASRGFVFQAVAFTPVLPFAPQARGGGGTPAGGGAVSAPSAPSTSSGARSAPAAPTTSSNPAPAPSRGTSPTAPGGVNNSNINNNNVNNNRNVLPGAGACPTPATTLSGTPLSQGPAAMSAGCATRNQIIPKIPETSTANQQIMFLLADGTGGFVIHDSNDLLGGLQKIGKEQNQYYLLGYAPPEDKQGNCHVLKVKVDRGGLEVRARTGYCSAKPMDMLSGSPVEKTLEAKIAAAQPGPLAAPAGAAQAAPQGASMRLPFFFASPNVARVNVAMDLPGTGLKFEKKKDVQHAEVNFLGIAYTPEGAVAARFSDTLKLDFATKEEADEAKHMPLHYENQFDIASGKYTFKMAFIEGGDNFGKLEMPLEVDSFKSDQFAISGLALSKEYHRTTEMGALLDAALIEDKKPLIAGGLQVVPAGNTTFTKSDISIFYVELYEPLLASADPKNPTLVGIQMRVLDRKTGDQKDDTGLMRLDPQPPAGNTTIPLILKVPVSKLGPGSYRLELTAADSADQTAKRTADFDIQ
jgi:VWFA-related protein